MINQKIKTIIIGALALGIILPNKGQSVNALTNNDIDSIQVQANLLLEDDFNEDDPLIMPFRQMKATATSEDIEIPGGFASQVLDGLIDTIWHTKFNDGKDELPQSITLDLGGKYNINKFSYLPRQFGTDGIITKYQLQVSIDGENFITIQEGSLENNSTRKILSFNGVEATHIRLVALEGVNGYASACELRVFRTDDEVPPVQVDKSELKATIDNASDLVEDDYTIESWSVFLSSLDKAINILENSEATQEQVNEAKLQLKLAIDTLVKNIPNQVSTINLQLVIEESRKITDEFLSKIAKNLVDEFKAALLEAENLLGSDNLTQDKIDSSFNRLSKALKNLVVIDIEDNNNNDSIGKGDNKLPETGGTPATTVGLFGTIIALTGSFILKKKK